MGMTKRKKWQHSLWMTAAFAGAFLLHVPILHVPLHRTLLYGLCVLLPQVVALIVQFMEVRDRYAAAFRKPEEGTFTASHTKSQPPRRRAPIYTHNSAAAIKCSGINPNRAGPATAFA